MVILSIYTHVGGGRALLIRTIPRPALTGAQSISCISVLTLQNDGGGTLDKVRSPVLKSGDADTGDTGAAAITCNRSNFCTCVLGPLCFVASLKRWHSSVALNTENSFGCD